MSPVTNDGLMPKF